LGSTSAFAPWLITTDTFASAACSAAVPPVAMASSGQISVAPAFSTASALIH